MELYDIIYRIHLEEIGGDLIVLAFDIKDVVEFEYYLLVIVMQDDIYQSHVDKRYFEKYIRNNYLLSAEVRTCSVVSLNICNWQETVIHLRKLKQTLSLTQTSAKVNATANARENIYNKLKNSIIKKMN